MLSHSFPKPRPQIGFKPTILIVEHDVPYMAGDENESHNGEEGASLHTLLITLSKDGGRVHYSGQLANHLAKYIDVTVIAPESNEVKRIFSEEVDLRLLSSRRPNRFVPRIGHDFKTFVSILQLVRRVNTDVVHFPFFGGIPATITIPLLKAQFFPIVATIHDPVSHSGKKFSFGAYELDSRAYLRMVVSNLFDLVIVHGAETKDQAVNIGYDSEKLRVVPHGIYDNFDEIDGEEGQVSEEVSEVTEDDAEYILFFGRFRRNKGFDRIPSIVSKANEELDEELTAVVAGSLGKERAWGKKVCKELEEFEHVKLIDRYVTDSEVAVLFSNAAIVVLPYYDATMSGVAMIAYAFDKPMVATDTGDLGSILREDGTGLLSDPDDEEKIVENVVSLVRNKEVRERLRQNVKNNKYKYSWDSLARKTVDLYRESE